MVQFRSGLKATGAVLLAVVMAACSSTAQSPAASAPAASAPAGASSTPAAEPSAAAAPVTLTFWGDPTFGPGARGLPDVKVVGDYEAALVAAFQETHPNVTINVQINPYEDVTTKTTAAIAAGTPPDLIRTTSNRQYDWNKLAPDLIYDLKDLLPAETIAAFPDDYINITTASDGKLYGIQALAVPIHLAANKTLFDEAGIAYPESGVWTRDEFEAACAKLVKQDRWCIAHQFSQPDPNATLQFLYASGADVLSPDGSTCTFNSPEAVETFTWLKSLDEKGYFIPGAANLQYEDPLTAQLEGRTVIYASANTGQRTRLREAAAQGRAIDGWLWAPLPLPQKGPENAGKGLYVSTTGFQAFKTSDDPAKKQALAEFLDFQLSPERNAEMGYGWGGIPARSDAAPPPDSDPDVDLVYKWVNQYGFNTTLATHPAVQNALNESFTPEMQAIWLGDKSVQEGLDALQAVCEAALAG